MTPKEMEKRATFFALFLLVVFLVLVGRLGYLQIAHGEELREISEGQRIRRIPINAPRGIIYDRNGEILATNRPAFTLSLNPDGSTGGYETMDRLDEILGMEKEVRQEPLVLSGTIPYALRQKGIKEGSVTVTAPDGTTVYQEGRDYRLAYLRGTIARTPESSIPDGGSVLVSYRYSEIRERSVRQRRPFEPIPLKRDIDPPLHVFIEENRPELRGVGIEVQAIREYPQGSLASHILGYVGEIQESQLNDPRYQGYRMGDVIGQMGLESTYDSELRGKDGGRLVEVDYKGRPVRIMGEEEPVPGNNLVLTIDARLQRAAEKAMDDTMKWLQTEAPERFPNARAGALVALDVRTGEILAMVSRPAFDPNLFAGGITRQAWEELSSLKAFHNRAIAGAYPPGSTFKMVTAIAALEEKKVTLDELMDDNGGVYWRIPMKDWKPGGHGRVNLYGAIAQSCNIFFYEMGYRLGIDTIARYARQFNLGQPTGLRDLAGEVGGLLPDSKWKEETFPGDPRWYLGETLNAAIGQGYHKYTPLQLVVYVSMIANGGIRYQPYLVKQVTDPNGKVIREFGPKVLGRIEGISPETLKAVQQGMLAVTRPGGTAYWRFSDFPIPVAGKTGTVEVGRRDMDDHGWFVAYAPFDDPRIAVVAIIEQGGGGSSAAAPVVRAVLEEYFGIEKKALSQPATAQDSNVH